MDLTGGGEILPPRNNAALEGGETRLIPTRSHLYVTRRCLLLSGAAILFAFSVPAQSPAPTPETPVEWPNLCANMQKDLLIVTTENGDTIQGYCVFVQHDELTVRTVDGKMVKIARDTLRKVLALSAPEHRLKALRKGMREGLREGVKMTFSPLAPIGLVVIPGTLAWAAVSTPFCILGDLFGVCLTTETGRSIPTIPAV